MNKGTNLMKPASALILYIILSYPTNLLLLRWQCVPQKQAAAAFILSPLLLPVFCGTIALGYVCDIATTITGYVGCPTDQP